MIKALIIFALSINVLAIKAIVKVHEAPVMYAPTDDSTILMKIRRGQALYIHANDLTGNSFYTTLTKDGRKAYIKKSYVKLLIDDNPRSMDDPIFATNDPTDYVIDEPLPNDYPLKSYPSKRVQVDFVLRKEATSRYSYTTSIERENISFNGSLNIKYLSPANFDKNQRLYYGFFGAIASGQNEYQLSSTLLSTESNVSYTFGPGVSYTFYKVKNFELETMLQVGLNYQRIFINQEDSGSGLAEEKEFSGFFLSSRIAINFSHKKIFDSNRAYFYHGPLIDIKFPYTLESDGNYVNQSLWSSKKFNSELDGVFGYNIGFTYKY